MTDMWLVIIFDKNLIDNILIFLAMGVLSVVQSGLSKESKWNLLKSFAKFFVNITSGVGFYSLIISYEPQLDELPQKIGVIMFMVYMGSKLLDLLVDKSFEAIKKFNFKTFIKRMFNL